MWHYQIILPPTKLAKKNQLGNNKSLVADTQNLLTHSQIMSRFGVIVRERWLHPPLSFVKNHSKMDLRSTLKILCNHSLAQYHLNATNYIIFLNRLIAFDV